MKISEIIYREEFIFSEVDDELEFDSITTNAEEIHEGCVFIVPNSLKLTDKINFSSPPVAVICDANAKLPENFPAIRVMNPRLAMAKAYMRYANINFNKMKIIGVTGTNGKTSTAFFIKSVLSGCGIKVGFIGTGRIEIDGEIINEPYYSMTTPDPALLYPVLKKMELAGCEAVVMEVSSHALALDKVAPLIFDYGVFTNFSSEHTDFHGSNEEYFLAKNKLFSICRCGVFNIDDDQARRAYALCKTRKLSAGILWRGDVWAVNIENRGFDGISYIYHFNSFSFKMNLKVAGIYNAYNSMLAAAVCIDMGCRPCEVKRILGEIEGIAGRYEIINDDFSVIIDYAHTDSAFNNIMKELAAIKGDGTLTAVFGCGGERDREKRPRMARIAEKYADTVIVTTDNSRNESPKDIISDIIKGFEGGCYRVIEDRSEAIRTAVISAKTGDVVAIIGKGCEKYSIDKNGYHDFNEKEIVMSALKARKASKIICE